MSSIFGDREVVRMRIKKCDGLIQPEYKKLCVDPQITSFDILRTLLAKAFNIKSDFTISYLSRNEHGEEVYLSMLSDWDLDAAFFGASDPQLRLKVDLKPFEEGLDDWDIVPQENSYRLPKGLNGNFRDAGSLFGVTLGSISTQVNRTVSQVSKAMGFKTEEVDLYRLSKQPMCDKEFHHFMDNVGHMVMPQQFRLSVYQGGVEHSLRKVVWRHLLNVFPEGMTGRERFDYLKRKSSEYYRLRDEWRSIFLRNAETEEIKYITNLVKKDVLRTDRSHKFYAGSDESQNIVSLFNILVTYALTHPDISYCQGMSDLASPILVVQNDEAHAYICFCGLMKRLTPYFEMDGKAMMMRFQHLSLLLQHHDPDFFAYLKEHKADDMFFCYRWLLLELKREFPFDNALRMLEIMWSSLLPNPPQIEVALADTVYYSQGFGRVPSSPTYSTNPYMKLKSMRQHSEIESSNESTTSENKSSSTNGSAKFNRTLTPCDELTKFDPQDFEQVSVPQSNELMQDSDKIEMSLGHISVSSKKKEPVILLKPPPKPHNPVRSIAQVSSQCFNTCKSVVNDTECKEIVIPDKKVTDKNGAGDPISNLVENHYTKKKVERNPSACNVKENGIQDDGVFCDKTDTVLSTSPKRPSQLKITSPDNLGTDASDVNDTDGSNSVGICKTALVIDQNGVTEKTLDLSSCEEALDGANNPSIGFINVDQKLPPLPPPQEFGHGNPFLMFLCLSLFVQHRDHIMGNKMDYNDLAMHFDKMVRKHDVSKVLHQAQSMYASYLKQQAAKEMEENEEEQEDVSV